MCYILCIKTGRVHVWIFSQVLQLCKSSSNEEFQFGKVNHGYQWLTSKEMPGMVNNLIFSWHSILYIYIHRCGIYIGLGLFSEMSGVYCKDQAGISGSKKSRIEEKYHVSTLINAKQDLPSLLWIGNGRNWNALECAHPNQRATLGASQLLPGIVDLMYFNFFKRSWKFRILCEYFQ